MTTSYPPLTSEQLDRLINYANGDEHLITFVYGTLRPGEGNYWIEPAVIDYFEPARTPGVLYSRGIPFADFRTHDQGDITGTVLVMEKDHRFTERMIAMESGAGYEALAIDVYLESEDGWVVDLQTFGWHYRHLSRSSSLFTPTHVPSGDFRDTPDSIVGTPRERVRTRTPR